MGRSGQVRSPDFENLLPREQEVLRMICGGGTYRNIAREVGYSERTVRRIAHGMCLKLNVRNTVELVYMAGEWAARVSGSDR